MIFFLSDQSSLLKRIQKFIRESQYSRCLLITNQTIHKLYIPEILNSLQNIIPSSVYILPDSEQAKTIQWADHCWQQMFQEGFDRSSLILSVGGGAVSDIAGFIAGCYMRGIDVCHIPTSLLAMVDASMGGKTGINLADGKNIVGIFHQPKAIFISTHFLSSLPERQYQSGLAEVVKYGLVYDDSFFSYLLENIDGLLERKQETIETVIKRCCAIKQEIVSLDEKDQDIRAILNYGHTFAHSLESLTFYEEYLHGEAVSIGISCAASVSHYLGYLSFEETEKIDHLLMALHLPLYLPSTLSIEQLIEHMSKDKKAKNGKISLILLEKIGKAFKYDNIDPQIITESLSLKQNSDQRYDLLRQ